MLIKGERCYTGIIDIPEGQSGRVRVSHDLRPPGYEFDTVSGRTALLAGHKGDLVSFDHRTRWHKVTETGRGTWMTDWPIEQYQHDAMLYRPEVRGDVLVGGLGVGYAALLLARRTNVKSITVVERSKDIIKLVWDATLKQARGRQKLRIVHADLFKYLRRTNDKFDFGFYDIWQSDGETTFHTMINPLRKLSRGKVRRVECWNEDIMRGQLFMGLHTKIQFMMSDHIELPKSPAFDIDFLCSKNKSIYLDWAIPFWKWFKAVKDSVTPNYVLSVAREYVYLLGRPGDDALIAYLKNATP